MSTVVIKPEKYSIGSGVTFGAQTDLVRPFVYHWKRNGALIGGSHWASYTSHPLSMGELTDKISVLVRGQDGWEESEPVQLETEPREVVTVSSAVKPVAPWQADIEAAIKEKL